MPGMCNTKHDIDVMSVTTGPENAERVNTGQSRRLSFHDKLDSVINECHWLRRVK